VRRCLVNDHGLQRGEPEDPDQEREAELRAAQADHPTEEPDDGPGGEPGQQAPRSHGRGDG
jgi:hypothetical protein